MKGLLTLGSCSFLYKFGVSIDLFKAEIAFVEVLRDRVTGSAFQTRNRVLNGGSVARNGCLQVDCRYKH